MLEGWETPRCREFEVAARLSQIGYPGLDPQLVVAARHRDPLGDEDQRALASHPLIARDLLREVSAHQAHGLIGDHTFVRK